MHARGKPGGARKYLPDQQAGCLQLSEAANFFDRCRQKLRLVRRQLRQHVQEMRVHVQRVGLQGECRQTGRRRAAFGERHEFVEAFAVLDQREWRDAERRIEDGRADLDHFLRDAGRVDFRRFQFSSDQHASCTGHRRGQLPVLLGVEITRRARQGRTGPEQHVERHDSGAGPGQFVDKQRMQAARPSGGQRRQAKVSGGHCPGPDIVAAVKFLRVARQENICGRLAADCHHDHFRGCRDRTAQPEQPTQSQVLLK